MCSVTLKKSNNKRWLYLRTKNPSMNIVVECTHTGTLLATVISPAMIPRRVYFVLLRGLNVALSWGKTIFWMSPWLHHLSQRERLFLNPSNIYQTSISKKQDNRQQIAVSYAKKKTQKTTDERAVKKWVTWVSSLCRPRPLITFLFCWMQHCWIASDCSPAEAIVIRHCTQLFIVSFKDITISGDQGCAIESSSWIFMKRLSKDLQKTINPSAQHKRKQKELK